MTMIVVSNNNCGNMVMASVITSATYDGELQ